MTLLQTIVRTAIDPALALLPPRMDTPAARIMLLATGLQESKFKDRRQLVGNPPRPVGPAKSLWQAELGGGMVHGVRLHVATRATAAHLYQARGVPARDAAIWDAIEHDDVLAAGLARLLLWSDPGRLPAVGDTEGAWALYLRTWRPGAYARGTPTQRAELRAKWAGNHAQALTEVAP
ncbi:Uncharacterised protein [Achromobacter denitrificans]|uniref:hypothetical protein n=1 Tax=Achromobacter denitrificans TaxID=32002 RepID=UPI0007898FD3|nr:hypothetical protein [Achromobacter denitrificans]OLU09068.1 hypothetical protein BVK87_06620 [Achromobacter denitrificans]QKH42438.1 hypothetical protein FOC82_13525 [Achromobacter denitrificans]QKH50418.1 hypothetical protein FOC80_13625 [Achromobacter denitrificans]CAB3663310.1 hypothetical protein LMG1231_00666 [Achromobacter denitrificans]SUU20703.1 Uncharacterised protein [Achromobacter denitrificans]